MRKYQIPAALALITNDEGKYLVTLRNDKRNPKTHMKWEIPGGSIEFGETPEHAAIRETREEVGLDVTVIYDRPIVKSTVWKHSNRTVHVVLLTYICKAKAGQRIVKKDREVLDYQWIQANQVHSLDYLPHLDTLIMEADKILHS